MLKATALAAATLSFAATGALAVTQSVRDACRNDYFAHCSAHPVDSDALKSCMRAVGVRLSPRCLYALVSAGEVNEDGYAAPGAREALITPLPPMLVPTLVLASDCGCDRSTFAGLTR